MGCFLACFNGDKDRKRRRPRNRRLPSDQIQESYKFLQENPPPKQLEPEVEVEVEVEVAPDVLGPELREKLEQESFTVSRKKVTFDLNVTAYEEAPVHQEAKNSAEEGEEKEGNTDEKEPHNDEGKAVPSLGAFPLNHRYQNCEGSDDEDAIDGAEEEEEYEDCDFDEDEDEDENEIGVEGNEEESYESFFSLPLEKERKSFREVNSPVPVKAASPDREPIILAKGSARDRSQYIHSVLNPVENLSQWKEVKEHATAPKNSMKENVGSELETKGSFSSEPVFKIRNPPNTTSVSNPSPIYTTRQEIPVDASLSNWLVSSPMEEGPRESNSVQSNSSLSREERPILGALTVEDLKQSSVTSSPRRSPSRSPDDIPIVGTVGSYWSSQKKGDDSSSSPKSSSEATGIPNTTSKYGEDKKVNWHSTPFEVRLERALNQSADIEVAN